MDDIDAVIVKSTKPEDSFKFLPNTTDVISNIRGEGIPVFVAPTNRAMDLESGLVKGYEVKFDDGIPTLSTSPILLRINGLGGIINRSRIGHALQATHPDLLIANNEAMRSLAGKREQASLVPDLYIPTVPYRIQEGLSDTAKDFIARCTQVVIKPNVGLAGKNIHLVNADPNLVVSNINEINTKRTAANKPVIDDFVIQPFMPSQIDDRLRAESPEDQSLVQENPIEIRVYCSFNRNGGGVYAFGRRIDLFGEDKVVDRWVELRQETVDAELFLQSASISKALMTATSSNALFLAVDFIFHGGRYYIMELNVRDPLYPTFQNYPQTSGRVSRNIADIFTRK